MKCCQKILYLFSPDSLSHSFNMRLFLLEYMLFLPENKANQKLNLFLEYYKRLPF